MCVGSAATTDSSALRCVSRTSLFPGWTPVRDFALGCDAPYKYRAPLVASRRGNIEVLDARRYKPLGHAPPCVQRGWTPRFHSLDVAPALVRGAGLRPQQTSPRGRGHALGPCLRLSAPPLRLTCWGRCCSQGCVLNALAPPQSGGSPGNPSAIKLRLAKIFRQLVPCDGRRLGRCTSTVTRRADRSSNALL